MQGNGLNKINYIQPRNSIENIIQFCQESGVPTTTGFIKGKEYGEYVCGNTEVDSIAYNQRCTTSCLVTKKCWKDCEFETLKFSLHRPVIGCIFMDLALFTYHATANPSVSVLEVKEIIVTLNQKYGNSGKWILIGDFNSAPESYDCDKKWISPDQLNYIRVASTRDRATEKDYCYLLYSSRGTQGSGEERENYLDFVFMSKALVESYGLSMYDNKMIENYCVRDEKGNIISDHNRITIELNLDGYIK